MLEFNLPSTALCRHLGTQEGEGGGGGGRQKERKTPTKEKSNTSTTHSVIVWNDYLEEACRSPNRYKTVHNAKATFRGCGLCQYALSLAIISRVKQTKMLCSQFPVRINFSFCHLRDMTNSIIQIPKS